MEENNSPMLPEFKSIEELAEFWDTHDVADYWDRLEEVDPDEILPRRKRVSIELPFSTLLRAVDSLAAEDARLLYHHLAERLEPELVGV